MADRTIRLSQLFSDPRDDNGSNHFRAPESIGRRIPLTKTTDSVRAGGFTRRNFSSVMGEAPPSDSRPPQSGMTRRECLRRGSAGFALASLQGIAPLLFAGCGIPSLRVPKRSGTVKVGILHSETGKMAMSETSLRGIELMAMEEINEAGGVLGLQIDAVVADGRSQFSTAFPKKARKLLTENKVVAVFGCWTSSSRKAVLPVFEELNGLLFYPVQYEGNESSKNIVYTGSTPNQQILPAIDWLLSEAGGSRKRIYLIGSDYIYPRTANFIVNKYLKEKGGEAVGESYLPMNHRDFTEAVRQIKKSSPDAILSTINGDSNISFYNELAAQGITAADIPVLSTSVSEDELRSLPTDHVKGHYSAWSYFQSLDTAMNKQFVDTFQHEHGFDRVTDDRIEAAYNAVYLWKAAVEKAGSFDVDLVRKAFQSQIRFEGPGGFVEIDPKTQHVSKRFRLGRVGKKRQFEIVHQSTDLIAPDPYPQFAFPGWSCDWTGGGVTKGAEVKINS